MPNKEDVALMAHLMRRAGFGATRDELDRYVAMGYEATVDELIDPPDEVPSGKTALLLRYLPGALLPGGTPTPGQFNWMYHMITTQRPLVEKTALFWHHVFATGNAKVDNCDQMLEQLVMFRKYGMGNYREMLVELSKNPAMLFWLDNNENMKGEPNENYGRELLELFSMGVGNYSEEDVKQAALAFTGWSFSQAIPYGHYPTHFVFRQEVHDYGEKTFLGETGRFNGEDIIDIIVKQPATARFICRRLYDFFVADEPQVPAWSIEPPRDPDAIDTLVAAYFDSGADIRSILRVLFNSDFFKKSQYKKVKSPAELLVGVLKLVGTQELPEPDGPSYTTILKQMGQELANPPSVESWHTGSEWIDGGALVRRVNFAANLLGDTSLPGVHSMVENIRGRGGLTPEEFVDSCFELSENLDPYVPDWSPYHCGVHLISHYDQISAANDPKRPVSS